MGLSILGTDARAGEPSSASGTTDNEVFFSLAAYKIQSGYNPGFWFGNSGRGVGYGRTLLPWLQFSARALLDVYGDSDSAPGSSRVTATAGPIIDIPTDERGEASAFFIYLGAGIDSQSISSFTVPGTLYYTGGASSKNFAYAFEIGKRFYVLHNVSWRPTLGAGGHTGFDLASNGTAHPALSIVPLALSILF